MDNASSKQEPTLSKPDVKLESNLKSETVQVTRPTPYSNLSFCHFMVKRTRTDIS